MSAIVGHPPTTEEDYWMARWLMMSANAYGQETPGGQAEIPDPALGVPGILPRPPGYTFESRQTGMIVACGVLTGLLFAMTLMRIGLRWFLKDLKWGADDWMIIPAALFVFANNICLALATAHGGFGKHIWDVTYHEYKLATIYSFTPIICTLWLALGFTKLSIALFLRRITGQSFTTWHIFNNVFIGAVVIWMVVIAMLGLFTCGNPRYQLDILWTAKQERFPKCLAVSEYNLGGSIIHIIMDFMLLGSAMILFARAQMSWAGKLRIFAAFSVGIFSCLTGVFRNVQERKLGADITWDWYPFLIWNLADTNSALFVANLPALSALFISRRRRPLEVGGLTLPGNQSGDESSFPEDSNQKPFM